MPRGAWLCHSLPSWFRLGVMRTRPWAKFGPDVRGAGGRWRTLVDGDLRLDGVDASLFESIWVGVIPINATRSDTLLPRSDLGARVCRSISSSPSQLATIASGFQTTGDSRRWRILARLHVASPLNTPWRKASTLIMVGPRGRPREGRLGPRVRRVAASARTRANRARCQTCGISSAYRHSHTLSQHHAAFNGGMACTERAQSAPPGSGASWSLFPHDDEWR
jgi:hypothetical protein